MNFERMAAVTVSVAGVLVAAYLLGRFAFQALLPFLIAFLLAALTHPPARRFAARTGLPQKPVAAVFVLLTLVLLGVALYFFFNRVILEAQNLLVHLLEESGDPNGALSRIGDFFERITAWIPLQSLQNNAFLASFLGDPRQFLTEQLQRVLSGLSERIPAAVGALLRTLPSVLLFCLVTMIACFYFAVEYEKINETLVSLTPHRLRERLPQWRERAGRALGRYLRAYFLLFLLTFGELWLGLLVLRVRYAFLLALLTALLDILPVLGVGVILVPWGLFSFVVGNAFLGVGLLLLYAVITVVRQITEPHLVGKSLGLHPVLMLIAFYVGIRFFGVVGIFVGPLLMLLLKAFLENRKPPSVDA